MPTLKDIAELTGVHPSTVSRALDPARANMVNPETRARVRTAAEELGFRVDAVASGLRRGRTMALGIIVADLGNPFAAPVIRGIENNLESHGYLAFITETQDDTARLTRVIDHLLSRRVDAIITLAARAGNEYVLQRAAQEVPVVLAVRNLPKSRLPGVVHDDHHGGRLAADHLLDLGHRRVSQLRGPQDISSFLGRGSGFGDRIRAAGAELIDIKSDATSPSADEGRRLTKELLRQRSDMPSGIFAHNDMMAMGAIQELRSAGCDVPADVSVIGYNDSLLTTFTDPPLTTIALPGYELGRFAAEAAFTQLDDPGREPTVLTLPPRLVARRSTAAVVRRRPAEKAVRSRATRSGGLQARGA